MSAKTVRVSRDGITWNVLPGNDASIDLDGQELDNTVFGADFNSNITGIIEHSFSGNAMLRKTAGFEARLKTVGASTVFTGEAMSADGDRYVIDDRTKSLWDYTVTPTFYDGATAIDPADVLNIDPLNGRVTFVDTLVVTGPVTVDGSFRATSTFGCANSIDLTQSAETIETGCFETVGANGGYQLYEATLRDVSADVEGFYRESNDFYQKLQDREEIILEVDWDGQGTTVCRGIFRVVTDGFSGGPGGDETESVSFTLSVPEGITPFSWYFGATSQAPAGLIDVIRSWEEKTELQVEYLPKGLGQRGFTGNYVITDCSMSTALDAIGEASITGQGTGTITAINTTP